MTTLANPCGAVTAWVVSANTWHITFCFLRRPFSFFLFFFLSFFLYYWDRATPPTADLTCFRARMCLLESRCWFSPFSGSNPPGPHFVGVNRLSEKKPACYQNYCIDSNQIMHNIKDHHVLLVDGSTTHPTNPIWRRSAAPSWKKTVKSPYLHNRWTDFDRIWLDSTQWRLQRINR